MHIKIGAYYQVQKQGITVIIKVLQHKKSDYGEVKWVCDIHKKPKHNIIQIRRKAFKVHLGDSLDDALVKSAEYFI